MKRRLLTLGCVGATCLAVAAGCKAQVERATASGEPSTAPPAGGRAPAPASASPEPSGTGGQAAASAGSVDAPPSSKASCGDPRLLLVFPFETPTQMAVMSELLAVAPSFTVVVGVPEAQNEFAFHQARFIPGGPYAPVGHPLSSTARYPAIAKCASREACEALARAARNVVGDEVPLLCSEEEGLEIVAAWKPLPAASSHPRAEAACARVHACMDATGGGYYSCARFETSAVERCARERDCAAVGSCVRQLSEKGRPWGPRQGPDLIPP